MPTISFEGDANSAVAAQDQVTAATLRWKREVAAATASTQKLAGVMSGMSEGSRTSQELLNRRIALLNDLVSKGKLTVEQAQRALDSYRQTLEKTADAGEEAFGDAQVNRLQQWIENLAGAKIILDQIQSRFDEFDRRKEEASRLTQGSLGSIGELAQIAPDQATFEQLRDQAQSFLAAGVFNDEGQAATAVFQLFSAAVEDFGLFLDTAQARFVAPENLVTFAGSLGQFRSAVGAAEVGSERDAINKLVAAAAPTRANAAQIAEAAAKLAPSLRREGFTDEEGLGALSLLTTVFGTAAEGGTRARALIDALDAQGIEGASLAAQLEVVNNRIAEGETARQVLGGSTEALAAFELLKDTAQLTAEAARIGQAAQDDALTTRLGFVRDSPDLAAAAELRRQEGLRVLEDANLSERASLEEALLLARERSARERARESGSTVSQLLVEGGLAATDLLRSIPILGRWTDFRLLEDTQGPLGLPAPDPQLQARIDEYLSRTAAATEEVARQQSQQEPARARQE